jgi:hypothetical protein
MRPEIAAFGAVVDLGRDRHRGEAHGIGRLAHIEEPGVAEALTAIGEIVYRGNLDRKRATIRMGIWRRGTGIIVAVRLSCKG